MTSHPNATDERIQVAEALLREVVFRARAHQALTATLDAPPDLAGSGRCGLGQRASVVLDLSPDGAALFARLWPADPPAGAIEAMRATIAGWIEAQDALDRRRNHFLKAFRNAHGFDRRAYTPEELASFDAGLAGINSAEDEKRRATAIRLLAAG